ncbi:MAG TPA: hypothetical protein VNJ46_08230 [Gaiellaceae bacterium]|nr:hypothetical protein [Gaiellaceae bacterium]
MTRLALGALLALALAGCGGSAEPRPDLVFVSTRDGDYALFAMNADGSAQTRLSEERGDPATLAGLWFQLDPAWSPDGRRIAFASRRAGTFDLYVMRADGTGTRRLTSGRARDQHPAWSPDGRLIAFERDESDIWVVRPDGRGARRLTGAEASESEPAWSPDGRWIAYVRREPGEERQELWLMRPDGSGARPLTALRARCLHPAWSPDGRRIAFSSDAAGPFFDVYVLALGQGRPGRPFTRADVRRLTRTGEDAFEPAWSPDGRALAFSRGGAIALLTLAGEEEEEEEEEELTDPKHNDSSPAWNPRLPAGAP